METCLIQESGDHLLTEGSADILVDPQGTYPLKEDHDKVTKEDTGGIFLEHWALQCEDDHEIELESEEGPLLLDGVLADEYVPRSGFTMVGGLGQF